MATCRAKQFYNYVKRQLWFSKPTYTYRAKKFLSCCIRTVGSNLGLERGAPRPPKDIWGGDTSPSKHFEPLKQIIGGTPSSPCPLFLRACALGNQLYIFHLFLCRCRFFFYRKKSKTCRISPKNATPHKMVSICR